MIKYDTILGMGFGWSSVLDVALASGNSSGIGDALLLLTNLCTKFGLGNFGQYIG